MKMGLTEKFELMLDVQSALQNQVMDCMADFEHRVPRADRPEVFISSMALMIVFFFQDDLEGFFAACREIESGKKYAEVMQ